MWDSLGVPADTLNGRQCRFVDTKLSLIVINWYSYSYSKWLVVVFSKLLLDFIQKAYIRTTWTAWYRSVFCFSCSVGKLWPNQCGEPITSNTWPLTLTLKAWPLCLLERRRTRWSFLRVLCRSKGNPATTLLRQAGWRNSQYFLYIFFTFDGILHHLTVLKQLMEIDGYILFHTTDPLADALPLPAVKTAKYINDKKNDVQSLLQISRLAGQNQHVLGGHSIV